MSAFSKLKFARSRLHYNRYTPLGAIGKPIPYRGDTYVVGDNITRLHILFLFRSLARSFDIGNGGIVYWNQLNTISKADTYTNTFFGAHEIRKLLNGHRSRWMRIYGLYIISNGHIHAYAQHAGDVTFSSSCRLSRFLLYLDVFEICTDTTAPSILPRFMHMHRMAWVYSKS